MKPNILYKFEKPKVQYGLMGDLKIFNKNLYVIPNSFTLQDFKDNLFNQLQAIQLEYQI